MFIYNYFANRASVGEPLIKTSIFVILTLKCLYIQFFNERAFSTSSNFCSDFNPLLMKLQTFNEQFPKPQFGRIFQELYGVFLCSFWDFLIFQGKIRMNSLSDYFSCIFEFFLSVSLFPFIEKILFFREETLLTSFIQKPAKKKGIFQPSLLEPTRYSCKKLMFFEVLLSKGVNEKHDADERERSWSECNQICIHF